MNVRRFAVAGVLVGVLLLGLAVSPAPALIERPYPLQSAIDDAQFIDPLPPGKAFTSHSKAGS